MRRYEKDAAGADLPFMLADSVDAMPRGHHHQFIEVLVLVFLGGIRLIGVQRLAADEMKVVANSIKDNAFCILWIFALSHDRLLREDRFPEKNIVFCLKLSNCAFF